MWILAGFALLGGIQVIDCPDGSKYAVNDPRKAPCVADCGDGTWVVEGVEECPGTPFPDQSRRPSAPPPIERAQEEPEKHGGREITIVPDPRQKQREQQRRRQETRMDFEVNRAWTSESGNYAYALVTITNRGSVVWLGGRVECTALASDGAKINMNDAIAKPVAPYGDREVKVMVGIHGRDINSMKCRLSRK